MRHSKNYVIIAAFIIICTFYFLRNQLIWPSTDIIIINQLERIAREMDRRFEGILIRPSFNGSYTEDKRIVYIKLHDINGNLLEFQILLDILLHELAHVKSEKHDPYHQTEEFHNNYRELILIARNKKLI